MLVRQLPTDIGKIWPEIRPAVAKALVHAPSNTPGRLMNLMESLLNERAILWIAHSDRSGEVKPVGIVITTFTEDTICGFKNLEIYALAASQAGFVDEPVWTSGMETLRKFARASGCDRIISYSSLPNVLSIAAKVGMDTSMRFLTIGV